MKRPDAVVLGALLLVGSGLWLLWASAGSSRESRTHDLPANLGPSSTARMRESRGLPAVLPAPPSLTDEFAHALRSPQAVVRDHALDVLLPELLTHHPREISDLALRWEPGAQREELLRRLITHWAAIDLSGVLNWVVGLRNEADRSSTALAVTRQVGQSDPAGAMDLAELLQVGTDDGSLEHYAQIWTESDPQAAVDWVIHQTPGSLRDRLLARIAWVRAQSAPQEAAQLTIQHLPAGPTRDRAIAGVVRQWALRDPEAAMVWVGTFPPGPTLDQAQAELSAVRMLR